MFVFQYHLCQKKMPQMGTCFPPIVVRRVLILSYRCLTFPLALTLPPQRGGVLLHCSKGVGRCVLHARECARDNGERERWGTHCVDVQRVAVTAVQPPQRGGEVSVQLRHQHSGGRDAWSGPRCVRHTHCVVRKRRRINRRKRCCKLKPKRQHQPTTTAPLHQMRHTRPRTPFPLPSPRPSCPCARILHEPSDHTVFYWKTTTKKKSLQQTEGEAVHLVLNSRCILCLLATARYGNICALRYRKKKK